MRPDKQYQDRQTFGSTMPDSEVIVDPHRFEGSFSGSEILDRGDDSTMTRHAQHTWQSDRDGSLTNDHWTKKTGKKRAFWSTIWTEKTSSPMDQAVWMINDPAGSLSSGEASIFEPPKPIVDIAAGESNGNASKNAVKEIVKPVSEDDDFTVPEQDKNGEMFVRSRSSSICSSGSCSGTGIFSREHVVSQSQLLLQYVDHLESVSWEDDQSSVLGSLVDMMAAVNHHVSSVDESDAGGDQEYASLKAEIRREKSQIKALVQELFGELNDVELAHRLIFQLDQ